MTKTTQKLINASERLTLAPEPHTRLQMNAGMCADHGIELSDYPNDILWLAIWNDRTGWYTEGKMPDSPDCAFCAEVTNESDCFSSRSLCEQWLWDKMGEMAGLPKAEKAPTLADYRFALQELVNAAGNRKMNVRKDYSLMVSIAAARRLLAKGGAS